MSEKRFRFMPSQRSHRHGMSSLPTGQCVVMACRSTSFGDLNALMQPCHSHRNGAAGSKKGPIL
jgi:hypothetical protein